MMSDQEQILEEISRKMDKISRLLALNLVKDTEIQKDQILTLSSFGFGPSEIAEMLRTTRNTVNVTLSQARKKKKKELIEGEAVGEIEEDHMQRRDV